MNKFLYLTLLLTIVALIVMGQEDGDTAEDGEESGNITDAVEDGALGIAGDFPLALTLGIGAYICGTLFVWGLIL